MSNNLSKPGVRAQARAISSEVKELQQLLSRALVGIESRLSQQSTALNRQSRILNALVELIGADVVQETVTRHAKEEAEQRSAAEKGALDEAIADGYVLEATEVTEQSLLVGNEVDEKGAPVGTGRQQISFRSIDPASQAELLGKKVGDKVKTPVGGEFEIVAIYSVDEEKGRAVLQAKAQKAAEEAAKADEAADAEAPAQATE
jgi:hypothetical protein